MFRLPQNVVNGMGWTLCATAFFLEFGSMSLAGWACWLVVAAVPPLVYASLAVAPPITITEVLYEAEHTP
jgi:hypothetical protein